jgi:UDP-glucose 4-epimerase
VFGADYPTIDGTGVRDYIHVMDLADGHVKALQYLQQNQGFVAVNLGTGQGYSVLQMVKAFSEVNDVAVPYQVVARRPGDIAVCYADPAYATALLGWQSDRYGARCLALATTKSGWLSGCRVIRSAIAVAAINNKELMVV